MPCIPRRADLGFPLALKIVSPDIAHKTDIGGVRLNIRDTTELAATASDIVVNSRRAAPQARLTGLLASEMVSDGIETIVGVINDLGFGPVVAFGLGGIYTEILRDVAYRVAPFALEDARAMLDELSSRAAAAASGSGPEANHENRSGWRAQLAESESLSRRCHARDLSAGRP